MYSVELPAIVKGLDATVTDPYNPAEIGVVNRNINACRLRVGSIRSVWFTNNYLTVNKNRANTGMGGGKTARGLKNALVTLSEIPHLRKVDGLKQLAHLSVNINPNHQVQATMAQRKSGTAPPEADIKTYSQLMSKIEDYLPEIIQDIAKIAKPEEVETSFLDKEEIYRLGERLRHVIDNWDNLKGTIPKPYEGGTKFKKQGDALVSVNKPKGADLGKSDIVSAPKKPVKHDTHSQNINAAQQAINQGFDLLKKNGIRDHELHAIRQKVQKSDNQLMTLMQVFQEFGISPNALKEAWLRTY
jgi:hypothetical protein